MRQDPELAAHLDSDPHGGAFTEILDYIRDDPAGRIPQYQEDARVVQAMAWLGGDMRVTCETNDHWVR